jgi:hypothetical protein
VAGHDPPWKIVRTRSKKGSDLSTTDLDSEKYTAAKLCLHEDLDRKGSEPF